MEQNNKLALIVAYYLSKFDLNAVMNLGYKNNTDAFEKIGLKLSVKPNTIKNMRDEFDSIHENSRQGWHQRRLRPSRLKVVERFQNLTEDELHEVVIEIIENKEFRVSDQCEQIIEQISNDDRLKNSRFVLRGPTGKKAEEFFIKYYNENKQPVPGVLVDTRDMGCGYDFEIVQGEVKFFIEVKGLSENTGGILFTNKEWDVAKKMKNRYYLALISNVDGEPIVKLFRNPARTFEARKNIYTTVQVNWTISHKQIKQLVD